MFDTKYLMNKQEKKLLSAGFFWNFVISLSMITTSIVSLVNAGLNINSATQIDNSSSEQTKSFYRPSFDNSMPFIRLSKYPSRSVIGYPMM